MTNIRQMPASLPRPQYVPVPEAFISALAWKILDVDALENETGSHSDVPMVREPNGKPIGLLYRTGGGSSRVITIKQTLPSGERLSEFKKALSSSGLHIHGSEALLAEAILNSLDGVRVEKSSSQPASPLTPSIALLQNMRGVSGVKGPPDVAAIVESLYARGAGSQPESLSASRLWLKAANRRMDVDPLLRALDTAVDRSLLGSRRKDTAQIDAEQASGALGSGDYTGTPFDWFAVVWNRLTSDAWVQALPARVWVDWATTVLRLATGMSFLWECAWNEEFARGVLREGTGTWSSIRDGVPAVLPWRSSRAGKVALDVAPQLISKVHRSERIRVLLGDWQKDHDALDSTFESTLSDMRADAAFRLQLTDALGSERQTNSGKNLWEAIKYALKTRETSAAQADYYGLLRTNGRYLSVEPGTEWIAVVASLACENPGGFTDVGRLMSDLRSLGMRPDLPDLIGLLERAGLARGSADADQGVVIESAF